VNVLLIVVFIACNASASVLVKYAFMPPRMFPSLSDPASIVLNGPLILGLAMYGLAFVLYAVALSRMPINVVHPVLTSGAIAVVAVLSSVLFREPLPLTTIAGIVLVMAGVWLITLRIA
jgi:small multidrug resistance pump